MTSGHETVLTDATFEVPHSCGGYEKGNHRLAVIPFLVELRGLEPLTPCMPCRCATSCATAPNFRCSEHVFRRAMFRFFVRISPKQLKYLRPALRKIPNRAYSARFSVRRWPERGGYSVSVPAVALAEASSPSCRSTTGQSFHRRSRA